MATGGEDGVVNIWKVRKVTKEEWKENMDVRIFEDQPVRSYTGHTVSVHSPRHRVVSHCRFRVVQERIPPLRLARLHRAPMAPGLRQLSVHLQAQVFPSFEPHI